MTTGVADLTDADLPVESFDDLAGVVDLFGALTRDELASAVHELAFKRGRDADADALDAAIDDAVRAYFLVEYHEGGDEWLTVGPVAFPSLPSGAEDLPHIMDVDPREVDRDGLTAQVETRLRGDAARAVNEGEEARMRHLLDVTYDLETWGDADVGSVRERLDAVLQD